MLWALAGIAAAVSSRVMCLPGPRSCCSVRCSPPSIRGRRHRVNRGRRYRAGDHARGRNAAHQIHAPGCGLHFLSLRGSASLTSGVRARRVRGWLLTVNLRSVRRGPAFPQPVKTGQQALRADRRGVDTGSRDQPAGGGRRWCSSWIDGAQVDSGSGGRPAPRGRRWLPSAQEPGSARWPSSWRW